MVGQGRDIYREGVSTVPCLPHPAGCHGHGGGGIASQYPGRMEEVWVLWRMTVSRLCTVQAHLQAYLSTPVPGNLADLLQWWRVSSATLLVAHRITALRTT